MDSGHPHAFLTPTTCFTVACVAFSILALSAVLRDQHTPPIEDVNPRPKPIRRRAVDSIYVRSSEDDQSQNNTASPSKTISQQLHEAIALAANVAEEVRSISNHNSTAATGDLLDELSFITSSLCQIQWHLSQTRAHIEGVREDIRSCLEVVLSEIRQTLLLLQVAVHRPDLRTERTFATSLAQLRDQHPALDFVFEHTNVRIVLPPSPPSEAHVQTSLNGLAKDRLNLPPPAPTPTGLTPSIDSKAWIEPPPEYSPPGVGSNIVVQAFKASDEKAMPDNSPPPSTEHIDQPADADVDVTSFLAAISSNDITTLKRLLRDSVDPNTPVGADRRTLLHHAAHINATPTIPILLRAGALVTAEDAAGDTPLHLAAWAGHVEALTALLSNPYTSSNGTSSSLDDSVVDFLSGRDGYTPLWCSISASHLPAARLLLQYGADPNVRSTGSTTMLHQAAISEEADLCSVLLSHGADVNTMDDEGNTALHYAATSGSVACVRTLLKAGADVDVKQQQGLTAVHWACHKGHAEVLELLLVWGADGNAVAEEGATGLHLAANRGHLAAVKVLLARGVKVDARGAWDGHEGTAADMARARGFQRIVKAVDRAART
jgi:ankyrin repeat protein